MRTRLNVRAEAPRGRVVASLTPGDRAKLLGTADGWHEVELDDGRTGFVSAAWTEVLPEPEPQPVLIPAETVDSPGSSGLRDSGSGCADSSGASSAAGRRSTS